MKLRAALLTAAALVGVIAIFFACRDEDKGARTDVAPITHKAAYGVIPSADVPCSFEPVPDALRTAPVKPQAADKTLLALEDIGLEVKIYAQPHEYIETVYNSLREHAPRGMWISAVLAQAYTEGGAGRYGIYARTNNCFGVTAGNSWAGRVFYGPTGQYYGNVAAARRAGAGAMLFRVYDNIENSVIDYVRLIENSGYRGALDAASPEEYLSYLLKRGYGEYQMLYTWRSLIYGGTQLKTYDRRNT